MDAEFLTTLCALYSFIIELLRKRNIFCGGGKLVLFGGRGGGEKGGDKLVFGIREIPELPTA